MPFLDVDECQSNVHRCGEGQLCHNLPGSYRCECRTGYQYDSFRRMCVGMNDITYVIWRKSSCFSLRHCTAIPLVWLPLLLPLFIILLWESCCCFPDSAVGLCSSRWAITSPAAEDFVPPWLMLPLLPLFGTHCVVTLIIMDSAHVFRLSADRWSPHIALSLTCAQARTGTYAFVQDNKTAHAWLRARTCTHGCKLTNAKCTHLSMMMMLPLSFRYKRVLELPRPSVCPDLWEHPRLLWVLLYLWFPLIWWWQELWRCVCVNVCLYGCVRISLCMLTHVTVDFCAFVHKNMCSCVFIETPCLYALIDRL